VPVVKRSGSYYGKTGRSGETKNARVEAARSIRSVMASETVEATYFSSFVIYLPE
jgi:hypothetical protein